MIDWNVLVEIRQHNFSPAYLLFEKFGAVYQSDFENVLLMKVESTPNFLKAFNTKLLENPGWEKIFSRIVPVTSTFSFQSQQEFEIKAKKVILEWLPVLAGRKFYVRMHRKGMKNHIDRYEEETFLDLVILQELEKIGEPALIGGIDPDVIVAVETISHQAGLSYWTRQDLQNYPWLNLDLPRPLIKH